MNKKKHVCFRSTTICITIEKKNYIYIYSEKKVESDTQTQVKGRNNVP